MEDVERHKSAARQTGWYADDCEALNIPRDATEEDYVGDDEWQMDMCGFSAIPYEAFVLPKDQVCEWQDVFTDTSLMQAEHNGEFDRYHLEKVCAQLSRRFDTMLAHHMLHNNAHKYLKPECVRYYTNLPYYSRDLEQVSRKLYCGMDNIATLLVARREAELMQQDRYWEKGQLVVGRLWDLYWGTAFPGEPGLGRILPVLEEQRRVGLRTDVRKALLIRTVLSKKVEHAERLISGMLGPFFNWRSPQQVKKLFYETWALPPQYNVDKKTRQKKLTTDDDARKKLRDFVNSTPERQAQYKNARIYFDLADYVAEKSKLLEYLGRIDTDQRIHAQQKAHGTATFRIATKPNVQNWPTWPIEPGMDSMRSIVIPDHDDDLFISVDFDQIELWTYAAQFNIKYLLEIYERGDYIYGQVFEDVLKKPFFEEGKPRTKKYKREDVTDQDLLRAKAVPLGFLYGRAGESVAAEHKWPASEGVRYKNDWFSKNPELPKAHAWIQYEMAQKGVLRPPPGLKLHFPQPKLQGLNCFGQTPAAIMLWTSMILIDTEFKRRAYRNTRICLSVHDSMLFNIGGARVQPSRIEECYEEIIKPVLIRPVPWLEGFRYRHSCKIGNMWDWKMVDYDKWIAEKGRHE